MKKIAFLTSLIVMVAILLATCGGSAPKDLLSEIRSRGYMLVEVEMYTTTGQRPANTKCPSDALTIAQIGGFDSDVAAEISKRLGVETCFVTPDWSTVTAGSWGGKWDVSIASMTITNSRAKVLTFTVPYYYDYAYVVVKKGSGINSLADLNGKAVCAVSPTVYEDWLNGKLDLPAADVLAQPPANVKEDAVSNVEDCAQEGDFGTNFMAFVDPNYMVNADIAGGAPIVELGGPVFRERLAAAADKSSSLPTDSFVAELNTIITAMHSDGTLTKFSIQDFNGVDYTQLLK
jgi:polar amino acid transport system substrate-binding protein